MLEMEENRLMLYLNKLGLLFGSVRNLKILKFELKCGGSIIDKGNENNDIN